MPKQEFRLRFYELATKKRKTQPKKFGYHDGKRSLTLRERIAKERIDRLKASKKEVQPQGVRLEA